MLPELLKGPSGRLGSCPIAAFGGLTKMFDGAWHVSLCGQNRCQVQMRAAEIGPQFERPLILAGRLGQLPLSGEKLAQ